MLSYYRELSKLTLKVSFVLIEKSMNTCLGAHLI